MNEAKALPLVRQAARRLSLIPGLQKPSLVPRLASGGVAVGLLFGAVSFCHEHPAGSLAIGVVGLLLLGTTQKP